MRSCSAQYLGKVGEAHRKAYAQFFTPPRVAEFMVDWVLQSGEKSLYDPAFGLGAFFDPVSDDPDIRFAGSEIDPKILECGPKEMNGRQAQVVNEDYLLSWGGSYANIVCNPPYMRYQKFTNRDKVFQAFAENLGQRLSGYTNAASAFLLKSLSELKGSGRLAYVMPLEFLNTGYGTVVKRGLARARHLVSIISLDCEKDVFPDATTSVGIILYDAARQYSHVDFHTVSSLHALENVLEGVPANRIESDLLDPDAKWLPHFQTKTFSVDERVAVPLSCYGNFSRGIATGANEFFVMRPSRAEKLGLSPSEILPCVTRSSQIRKSVFDHEDYEDLVKNDAPVFLFNAGEAHSECAAAHLHDGEQRGYHARFLTRNRSPWYEVEHRLSAPLLVGAFFRGTYKVIRNKSEVLNLTCFHGFRPNRLGQKHLDRLFLYLASDPGRGIVALSSRKYGGALDKFEPNDLNSALVPQPQVLEKLSVKDVADALSEVEKTCRTPDWVNRFFGKMITRRG